MTPTETLYIALATLQYPVTGDDIRASAYPSILPLELDHELLAELGFAPVETVEPPELGPRDTLTELPPELIDGVWRQRWSVTTEPEPAPDWPTLIAERRWRAETGGIIWRGYGIATDRDSRALIDQEMLAIDRGTRADGEGWKCLDASTGSTVFWKASNADFETMSLTVRHHVRACFDREEELLVALNAGTLTPEMLEEGWAGI